MINLKNILLELGHVTENKHISLEPIPCFEYNKCELFYRIDNDKLYFRTKFDNLYYLFIDAEGNVIGDNSLSNGVSDECINVTRRRYNKFLKFFTDKVSLKIKLEESLEEKTEKEKVKKI